MANHSFIGKGPIYVDDVQIGNCTSLKITTTEDEKKIEEYRTVPGGSTRASVMRIKDCKIAFTCTDISPDNLAIALRADVVTSTGSNGEIIKTIKAMSKQNNLAKIEFRGVNEFDTNQTVNVTMPFVRLGLAKQIDLISDDFAKLDIEGTVIADYNELTGKSTYFDIVHTTAV